MVIDEEIDNQLSTIRYQKGAENPKIDDKNISNFINKYLEDHSEEIEDVIRDEIKYNKDSLEDKITKDKDMRSLLTEQVDLFEQFEKRYQSEDNKEKVIGMTILSDREIVAYTNLIDLAIRRGNKDLMRRCYINFTLRLSKRGYWRKVYEDVAKKFENISSHLPLKDFEVP